MRILVLNGPNLNMTGLREKKIYGTRTLPEIEAELCAYAKQLGCTVDCMQENSEGALLDILHAARGNYDALVINAGAYSHYSYALRDSIVASELPAIEVHISNVFQREEFRHHSVLAPVCIGYIAGLGEQGYKYAIDYFCKNAGGLQ